MTTNSSPTKNQLRGHCPVCGRIHAVTGGLMAKHGYTVDHGWFSGVCAGQFFAPLEIDRNQTDSTVALVRAEVAQLREKAARLRSGEDVPATGKVARLIDMKRVEVELPFSECPAHVQRAEVDRLAYSAESRARHGEVYANQMEALADRVHGQPLLEVERNAGPAPIREGEQRRDGEKVYTATSVSGARVYWVMKRGDEVFKGWTGSAAWRRLELVA